MILRPRSRNPGTSSPSAWAQDAKKPLPLLATVETLFGLRALTNRDGQAKNLLHPISNTLRTDCPVSLGRPAPEPVRPQMTDAHRLILDQQPLPDHDNLIGFLGIAAKTDRELSGGPAGRTCCHSRERAINQDERRRARLHPLRHGAHRGRESAAQER